MNDGADRNVLSRPRQGVAAARPSRAPDHARAPEPKKDLLHIVGGKPLLRSNLPARHRVDRRAPRQMQRADHTILGPRRYAHTLTICERAALDKPRRQGLPQNVSELLSGRPATMLATRHSNLGHFSQIEHFVDLGVWKDTLALHQVANENILLH